MKLLNFLRLTDAHDSTLSLTNVALWVVLVKIAMAGSVSIVDAGALFVTLLSYQSKKVINKDAGKASEVDDLISKVHTRIDELATKVNAQQVALGIKELKR